MSRWRESTATIERMAGKALYITAMPHSGAGLTGLLLGLHPMLIGIGNAYSLVGADADWQDRADEVVCSCGSSAAGCAFWGRVRDRLGGSTEAPTRERYRLLLEVFHEIFPGRIPVDSSGSLEGLESLVAMGEFKVNVLHQIRDVRGWSLAARRAGAGRSWFALFRRWYRENRRLNDVLSRMALPAARISYDELGLYPGRAVAQVCEFLHLEPVDGARSWADTQSHCLLGNSAAAGRLRRDVSYDDHWLHVSGWLLATALCPGIMRYNARTVYGNIATPFDRKERAS